MLFALAAAAALLEVFKLNSSRRPRHWIRAAQFFHSLRLLVSPVRPLENHIMPIAHIRFAKTALGHFLATFFTPL